MSSGSKGGNVAQAWPIWVLLSDGHSHGSISSPIMKEQLPSISLVVTWGAGLQSPRPGWSGIPWFLALEEEADMQEQGQAEKEMLRDEISKTVFLKSLPRDFPVWSSG